MSIKMKLLLASLLACSPMLFGGDGTVAGTSGQVAYGGASITSTTSPHNLGGSNAADNGEVCVYCHTPHAADSSFAGAPIWNKGAMTSTFTMYGTTVGGTAADATPASPSLVCLSCHDGISAVDSILNAPGSGMRTIAAGSDIVTILATPYGGNIGGTAGTATVGTVGNLANDHPVSITYDATKASLRATGDTIPVGTSGDAWVTPGGGTTVAALLRSGKVECSSCHDPHNATGVAQATAKQVNYLRHTNVNSELCFGCHNK